MFNPDDYRHSKEGIIKYFEKNGVDHGTISEYAATTMIPITVICTFIMEDMPEHEKLCKEKIKQIQDFLGL